MVNKLILSLLLLFSLSINQIGYCRSNSDVENIAAVRKVLSDFTGAFERNDLAAIDRLWSHNSYVTVYESGLAFYGWENYRDNNLKVALEQLKKVKFTLGSVKVQVKESLAWATFDYSFEASSGTSDSFQNLGLATVILEKKDKTWQIVHWHSTNKPKRL